MQLPFIHNSSLRVRNRFYSTIINEYSWMSKLSEQGPRAVSGPGMKAGWGWGEGVMA